MGRRRTFIWREKYYWAAMMMQIAMFSTATNITTDSSQVIEEPVTEGYAWSSWGSWSACSRSCGGGVAVQERLCLPRSRSEAANEILAPPIITVRVAREVTLEECAGVAKRYHECNTAPCPSGERDIRAEQCSSYNHRPFRGRFYSWVPYIDGDSPCMLNCRPVGQYFYASLALAVDGTPCTKPGFRAICVQGTCKVVGRDAVLAVGGSREARCGRRLVSGLFARPRLPLGYSYIATVPRGACRLNVSEIVSSDNYIALKISNGSYIMNGEFAVSAPGIYEAVGARFSYSRNAGQDSVFALGPTLYPIDIMVLYTQPNPSIKYEYLTEALPGEVNNESISTQPETISAKHSRRHHGFDKQSNLEGFYKDAFSANGVDENIETRKFIWKIISYTQCSRSCGGGIQVGKYRCVEASSSTDREVSPVHCSGSQPAGRRRRCGSIPCAPRWRTAAWTACPVCGPATRNRIVGCVQDHSKGIIKISDHKCPAPKPSTTEPCNIPECTIVSGIRPIESKSLTSHDRTEAFREGPVYTVSVNTTDYDIGPEYSLKAVGWLYTDWSKCVGWCVGGGIQTRAIRCVDPTDCTSQNSPELFRSCSPNLNCEPHDGQWFTGEWSACTQSCNGKQVRGVLCIGGTGRHLRDAACRLPRPETERACGGECEPNWYTGDWGQCTGNCSIGVGVQRRSVVCARGDSGARPDGACPSPRPHAHRACELACVELSPATQRTDVVTVTETEKTTTEIKPTQQSIKADIYKGCEDKLPNCALAVQARLCHYKYYTINCCDSCKT